MNENRLRADIPKIFKGMEETFNDRGQKYKDNYLRVGEILAILYPDGVSLSSPDDFTKWHLIDWMVGKLTRFAASDDLDSIHDLSVYAAMIEGVMVAMKEQSKAKQGSY